MNREYPDIQYDSALVQPTDNNVNMVIIGHVDSGKSTLTGHLLHKLGHISSQVMHKNKKLANEFGKTGFEYAYILDETEEERQRGVTIEVTTKFFCTPNRHFTILDAPGHRDFISNMITGAANANCAILCIDSQPSGFERGWTGYQATAREHTKIARAVGVTQIIVAINKLET